jgi:F-type H+-transporting ATPase subunit delta
MIVTANAKRYAKALFELASEKDQIDKIHDEFKAFLNLIAENPDLKSVLSLPGGGDREKLFSDLMKERFSELFFNFLLLVLKNKRFYLINQIYYDFVNRVDSHYNQIRVEAITAIPLPDDRLSEVSQQIAKYLDAEVRLENKVDPSIIGGIIIRLNGKMFNASLAEQFKRLKQYLWSGIN